MSIFGFDGNKNKTDVSAYVTETEWTNLLPDSTTLTDSTGNTIKLDYLRSRKVGKIVEINGYVKVTLAKASGKLYDFKISNLPTQFKPYTQYDFDHTSFDVDEITTWRKVRIDSTGISLSVCGLNTASSYVASFAVSELYMVK